MTISQKQLTPILIACVLGGLIASLQYTLPKSNPKADADAEWILPKLPDTAATHNAYNALSQYFPKNTSAGQGQGGTQPGQQQAAPTWTLQGMARQGQRRYALINIGAKITRYQIGEQLPDSSLLTAIGKNGITLSNAGTETVITLHAKQRP